MREQFQINDIFWTFQGEGTNAGRRALFIRLPRCNLRCSWCDTEFNTFKTMSREYLEGFFDLEPARFVVITGGEPLMNPQLKDLIELLQDSRFEIACETNGTYPYVDGIDFVTCSPKRDADFAVDENLMNHVKEFKFVVDEDFDFNIVTPFFNTSARVSLSPEFNTMNKSLERIYDFIKRYPEVRLSLQSHKWIGLK